MHNLCDVRFYFLVSCAVAQAVLDIDKKKHKTIITTPNHNASSVDDDITNEQSHHVPTSSVSPEQSHLNNKELIGATGKDGNPILDNEPGNIQKSKSITEKPVCNNGQTILEDLQNYDLLEYSMECNNAASVGIAENNDLLAQNIAKSSDGLQNTETSLEQKTTQQEKITQTEEICTYAYNDGDCAENVYTENGQNITSDSHLVVPSTSNAAVMDHNYFGLNDGQRYECPVKPDPTLGFTEYRKQYITAQIFYKNHPNYTGAPAVAQNGTESANETELDSVTPKTVENELCNHMTPQHDPHANFREIVSAASSGSGCPLNQRFSEVGVMLPQEEPKKTEWTQPLVNGTGLGKVNSEQAVSMSKEDLESNSTISATESVSTNEGEKKKKNKKGRKKYSTNDKPQVRYDTRSKKKID